MKALKKYLRELSIVVVGIGITFFVSNQISNFNERRMVNRHLDAIKSELEQNLELINKRYIFYNQTRLLADYLRHDKLINLNSDSIYNISIYEDDNSVIDNTFILTFETTALETFKASGLIALVKNDVSQAILKAYKRLDGMAITSNEYMDQKGAILTEIMLNHVLEWDELYDLKNPRVEKLFYFHSIPNNYHEQLKGDCTYFIQKALSLL